MANKKESPTFNYIAKSPSGEIVEKKMKAPNAEAVQQFLLERKYMPLDVEEIDSSGLSMEISLGKGKRVKTKDLSIWCRNFATMYNAGLPIAKTLHIMGQQTENARLKEATIDVKKQIDEGAEMANALSMHPDIFPDLMINMIRAGEAGGLLDETLKELAKTMEADVRLKGKIKSAMTYPVVVLIMAALMCVGMLLFIVPTFEAMFESLGGQLPLPTRILVMASDFLKVGVIPIAIGIFGFVIWWRKNKAKPWIRNIVDPAKLKIPVFGKLFQMVAISRFARNLGTLMGAGVPIVRALDVVADTTGSVVVSRAIHDVKESVSTGQSMAAPLANHPIFPPMTVQMIEVGDESGGMEIMLSKIADVYDEDVEMTTEALTSLIEPLMIVFLGIVVGGMIIALYLPIFSVYDLIQ